MLLIGKRNNITNQHNIAGADIIRPRNSHDFIGTQLAGCGDPTHRCRRAAQNEVIKSIFLIYQLSRF